MVTLWYTLDLQFHRDTDGQQFHQYLLSEQLPSTSINGTIKKTTTYDVGNPGLVFGRAK